MLDIDGRFTIPSAEMSLSFARSSGPGGQNVNKVNSKVTLTWSPVRSSAIPPGVRQRFLTKYGNRLTNDGNLLVVSQRYRDQPKNIEDCREKLREMIRTVLVAPIVRRPTRPTKGSKERRISEKKHRSEAKARRRIDKD